MSTLFFRKVRTGLVMPLLFLSFLQLQAQNTPLDRYVQEGLQQNIVLQQKNIALDGALTALQSAQSLFLPTVSFQGSYQIGQGGRAIDLPIGDLMNPVFNTLNDLTGSHQFNTIANVKQDFLPYNFHDLKVRTTLPILNADIKYNRQIESGKVQLQQAEIERYSAELARSIRTAYFQYLSAGKAVAVQESALDLALEEKRTNERLLANGKGLPSYVLRSQSEVEGIRARIFEARKGVENAQLYFNFLLNRESAAIIDTAFPVEEALQAAKRLLDTEPDVARRAELRLYKQAAQIQETALALHQSFRAPKLNGFLDLGTQSQHFKFNAQSRYYFAGLQLDVPIFNGRRNLNRIRQSALELKSARLDQDLATLQLTMAATQAKNNLNSAWQNYQSAREQVVSARSYAKLIDRGYREGINTFIENIDARNLLTSAELQLTINQYKVLSAAAQYEFETASLTK